MNRYTVAPGRNINRDGKPFIRVQRRNEDTSPAEVDSVIRELVRMLNERRTDP
jgi:hypothetical protein